MKCQLQTRNPEWRSLEWKWTVKGNELLLFTLFNENKIVSTYTHWVSIFSRPLTPLPIKLCEIDPALTTPFMQIV